MEAETLPDDYFEPAKRPRIGRIEAVVNEASGGVGAGAAAELQSIVEFFGIALRLASVGPAEIDQAVRAAVASAPDLVVTLAGDGTARLAAELCGSDGPARAAARRHDEFARARPLREKRLARGARGRAGRGGYAPDPGRRCWRAPILCRGNPRRPALWAPAREAVRNKKLRLALLRAREAFARAFTGKLHFQLDGASAVKAEALALLSPLISDASVDQLALEAIVLDPRGAADVLRLGVRALVGAWRDDPAVSAQFCRHGHAFAKGRSFLVSWMERCNTSALRYIWIFAPMRFMRLCMPRSPLTAATRRRR